MRIIDPGHIYQLDGVGDGAEPQRIVFVKNEGDRYPGNVGHHPGILTQEVLRAAIDRTAYLNAQESCLETEHALAALRQALAWYEVRAARCRGTHIEADHADGLDRMATCPTCGHNQCDRGDHHERLPGTAG